MSGWKFSFASIANGVLCTNLCSTSDTTAQFWPSKMTQALKSTIKVFDLQEVSTSTVFQGLEKEYPTNKIRGSKISNCVKDCVTLKS